MTESFDVAIAGGGPAGLCFARSLSMLGLSVAIVEKQAKPILENPPIDGRDVALTHLSRRILSDLGIWNRIPADKISNIREARVINGPSAKFMRLSSSSNARLAFIVPNHFIRAAAYEAVKEDKNITLMDSASPEALQLGDHRAEATLSDGRSLTATLIAAADSRFSQIRKKAGIPASLHDFGKTMIVCQMEHDLPHYGVAHECFLHSHTLAILPLNGDRSSVIITVAPPEAERALMQPETEFNFWVARLFQHRLGTMRLDSGRHAFPLVAAYADRFIAQRLALVGDAAVGMHPVTAHGFNFGLRGISTLSDLIGIAFRSGRDIGSEEVLKRYQQIHRRATLPLYLATNGIVSLYTNDSPPAMLARGILLRVADRMTPIKSLLMAKLTEKNFPTGVIH